MPLGEPRTHTQLVLQNDYNAKRSGEPDNWGWQDSVYKIRGDSLEAKIADAKRYVQQSGTSKFIRGWRIVERTTVESDALIVGPFSETGETSNG